MASELTPGSGAVELLSMLRCVIRGRMATYISGPITTGARYLEWYVTAGNALPSGSTAFKDSFHAHVFLPNRADLLREAAAADLRAKGPVIEPVSLTVDAWLQPDYHRFWVAALAEFVSSVIVVPQWQYSVGCSIEVEWALRHGADLRLVDGQTLTRQHAASALRESSKFTRDAGKNFQTLIDIADALEDRASAIERTYP